VFCIVFSLLVQAHHALLFQGTNFFELLVKALQRAFDSDENTHLKTFYMIV
jgi:hypothetical protein